MSKIECNHKIDKSISFGVELEVGKEAGDIIVNRQGRNKQEDRDIAIRHTVNFLNENGIDATSSSNFDGDWKKNKSWIVHYDSSIKFKYQIELRSPVLKGENGLLKLCDMIVLLRDNGFLINESCGFHIHINANEMDFEQIKRIVLFFAIYEDDINATLPKHRQKNNYCMELTKFTNKETLIPAVIKSKSFNDLWKIFPEHHVKVNVENLLSENKTIEFRQHHMSFNRLELKNWIRFICFIIKQTKKRGVINEEFLSNLQKEKIPLNEMTL